MPLPTVKVAACHVSSVYLDADGTAQKCLSLIDQAASAGANLVVFPEAFIPGFPFYPAVLAPVDHAARFSQYVSSSIYADGPELGIIRSRAAERGVAVSLGFSERSRHSVGCIWNSNVLISEAGVVLAHHRKLMPTYWEKLVWAPGDGEGLRVGATEHAGRVGALICGENTNPLARFAMLSQEEHIHVASFPPAWPTKREGGYANRTANGVRGAAHAFEAKCFAVVCAGFLDRKAVADVLGEEDAAEVVRNVSQGGTQFFGPDGVQFGEELVDEEGIAYAECDLNQCLEAKRLHDVAGSYNRFDVFDFTVTRKRLEPVRFQ